MAMLGLGEMIGGYVVGQLRDNFGNATAISAQLTLIFLAVISVMTFNRLDYFNLSLAYLMCFLWGLQDSGINCLLRSILGFEFESNLLPFSVFSVSHSLTVFAAQLIEV
jgi:predicted MFS family arabinose efflux permease